MGTTNPASSDPDTKLITIEDASDDSRLARLNALKKFEHSVNVANDVDMITVEATPNHSNAYVFYVNGMNYPVSSTELTDADALKDGFQVSLSEGNNDIFVQVIAEDGFNRKRPHLLRVYRNRNKPTAGFVSNTGQARHGGFRVGNIHSNAVSPAEVRLKAQRFTTGGNSGGYTITNVVVATARMGGTPKVSIYSNSSGAPGSSLYVLTNPGSFPDFRNTTFTAPAGSTLAANTHYWVVFENANTALDGAYYLPGTVSDREDSGAASGWSIANGHSRSTDGGTSWSANRTSSLQIAIQGTSAQHEAEPLTAEFLDEPVSHDGSSAFTLQVSFSEDVEITPEDLRDHALSATGGTITGVVRVEEAKDLFEVTVEPSGEDAVSVTLISPPGGCEVEGGVCTADGTALSSALATRVRGPGPGLTVADAQATEGTDSSLDFVVTLSPAATETVTVAYATSDGTASAPADYASASGTLTFAAGETSKTVSVDIVDDVVEDDGETMTFTLSGAMGAAIDDHEAVGTINNTEPLTASFSEVPSEHDGSEAFTFTLTFSEDVDDLSFRTLKFDGIQVSGGTVTRALRRPPGKNQYWTIHIEPDGDGDVTVTLPETTDCAADGAVCAPDGRKLSNESRATVPGPATEAVADTVEPLTASFSDLPSEHDGSGAFTFTLTFSEDVGGLSFRTLKFGGIEVTGGTVTRALRRPPGVNQYWTIHVEPDDHGAVTVVLPETTDCAADGAVCTSDGRMLSNESRATVQGPPGLAVADAEVNEADADAALAFVVTLDRAASGAVTVDYATSDGTAVAPGDYTETSGTLTFAAGETEKTVSVPVIADAEDEGSETLTLTLSNPTGAYLADATATGTIENDGPIPQAWLARFGRTVADQVLDAVDARLRGALAPGVEATIAGQALSFDTSQDTSQDADALAVREDEARAEALSAWLRGKDSEEDRAALSGTRTVSERDLFTGTSFSLTGGTPGEGTVSAWGRGAVSTFNGREGELTLDGEVGNLMLGADFTRGRAAAGLMLSHAQGNGGYRGASEGRIEASLTGLYPYGRYVLNDRLSVWGVAGYGEGTLTVEREEQAALETDMDLAMASVGVRGVLLKAPPEGGAELAIKSDAMAVRTTSEAVRGKAGGTGNLAAAEADVTRLRLSLEGSRAFGFAGGASLTPSVELGVRHDGGDAETGFGADIGTGLAWSDPARGLSADMRARGLLTHEDGSFSERGFAGSLAWDPAPDSARGPSLSIGQTVGAQASGGVEALLGPQTAQALEAANDGGNELERRTLEAKFGYGFALFDGGYTGTPKLGLNLTDTGRETVLGWRLAEETRAGLAFGFDVEAARRENAEGAAGHRFGLGFGWRLEGVGAQAFEVRFEGSRLEPVNAAAEHRGGLTLSARW